MTRRKTTSLPSKVVSGWASLARSAKLGQMHGSLAGRGDMSAPVGLGCSHTDMLVQRITYHSAIKCSP